ncbi:S41 family peptidase [Hymenobacter chitinivorans]|uniref:Peptidase S41-like protein n=1 Tax=Hymenobacter chitinivorans DSM 11115 TaxID=1121954 RepID=A0A2M9B5R0_9BACT|nr:S41 family peptidase [Hymenobacter chitinivorans]PJJ53283.1 peptidase S41-like protein [Hymenobacter chitinivorans DSM 11115]
MKTLLLVLTLCLITVGARAQSAPPAAYNPAQTYPVAQLQSDLTYLRRALEEAHPGLYWYTSPDSLHRAFARAAAALTHPMTEPEYWKILQTLVAQVRCGHTRVQHSAAYRTWFRRQPHPYFPFSVAIRQNRLFVVENQSTAPELRPGTEILTLDGHPSPEVLARLRALISADGYGTGFQDHELEAGFFDEYYWSCYEAKPAYPLLVRDSTGHEQLLTPQPRPSAPAQPAGPALSPGEAQARRLAKLRSVRYPAALPATAVLRISSFSYDEADDYQTFHAALFAELAQRRTKRLVVDLRGNPGGNNAIAVDLLKYLLKSDFVLTQSALAPVRLPSFMQPDPSQAAYFDTTLVKRLPDGRFGFAAATVGVQHPYRGRYFRGQVVLLVDGGTFSAASNLAASLRAQRRVVILGEESGGAEAGLSGGTISRLELPQTHLVLQLPHFRLLTACPKPQPGRGVQPNRVVVPTPLQVATRTDAILTQLPLLLR